MSLNQDLKKNVVAEIKEKVQNANSIVLVDFKC